MYDLLDQVCAETLGVSVEEYIEKIESTTNFRRETIIIALLNEDEKKHQQAIKCFKMIKL